MQKVRVPLTNFQFGEISPSLLSRTDTGVYSASAQRVKNFLLRSEGGVIKRSGTRQIYRFSDITYDATKSQQSRLLSFVFSDDEQYIISLEHQKVRIFIIDPDTGVVSLTETIDLDINGDPLPFDEQYLHEYTFAQAGDVMWICHPLFMPREIVRTSLTTFVVELFSFDERADGTVVFQPYYDFSAYSTTLSSSLVTGSGATLTTSTNYFTADHVGVRLLYHDDSEILITAVASPTSATGNISGTLAHRLISNALKTIEGSAVIEVTHINHGFSGGEAITIVDSSSLGGISKNAINGAHTVASIIDENTYKVNVGSAANASEDGGGSVSIQTGAATTNFLEQSFSELRGYPASITLHENRLCFAGTLGQPDSIWMSKSGEYYNFFVGDAEDSDSIQVTSSIGIINQIRHMVSSRDLHIFGATGELYIPSSPNQPLTPTNLVIRRQTPYGCNFAQPQSLDGATLFVQKNGLIVREYIYTDTEAAYTAASVSSLSSHLIKDPFEMAVLRGAIRRNESYAFVVNSDGSLAVFNSNRAEERAGWTEFVSGGLFKSVCVVDDRVFTNILVDIGDGTKRYVLCEFDANYNLDVSNIYNGTNGVFNVSGDFEDGANVYVINGSNSYGLKTVTGGSIDVSNIELIDEAEIGFRFDVELITNPIDAKISIGPLTGQPRGIGSVIVDLNNTLSVSVNGTSLIIRKVNDDLEEDRIAVTGKKEFRLLGYNRDPQITITQVEPLSLQVNGIIAELTF
jgi:hypothetical protein